MELTLDLVIKISGVLVTVGGLVALFKRHEKDYDSHKKTIWSHVDTMKAWQLRHQEESAKVRLEIQAQITDLQVSNGKTEEKFNAIMTTLNEIKADMKRRRNGDIS